MEHRKNRLQSAQKRSEIDETVVLERYRNEARYGVVVDAEARGALVGNVDLLTVDAEVRLHRLGDEAARLLERLHVVRVLRDDNVVGDAVADARPDLGELRIGVLNVVGLFDNGKH